MERLNELYESWLKERLIKAFENLDNDLDTDSDWDNFVEIITSDDRDFAESLEKTSTPDETLHIQEVMSGLEYNCFEKREWLNEVFNDTFYLWLQIKFWGERWEDRVEDLKKN